jgi:predicted Rossmann fold nucleotide-binding protein DprA/Smf involved in DNA uptake
MKAAVIGSRTFDSYQFMEQILRFYDITLIISGGAKGADACAKQYAHSNGISYREYLPDWDQYGKRAGFLRNRQIVNDAEIVIAFWDSVSKGTKNSVDIANDMGKEVYIYWPTVDDFLSTIGKD